MDRDYSVTPPLLLQTAHVWIELYESKRKSHDIATQLASIYCLLLALEMYLKAYLAFLNRRMANKEEMQKLSHNLNSLYRTLIELGDKEVTSNLKPLLCKYDLFIINFNEFRYPTAGRNMEIYKDLLESHGFDKIFNVIEKRVKKWRGASSWNKQFTPFLFILL
jgi:hypothetical protein